MYIWKLGKHILVALFNCALIYYIMPKISKWLTQFSEIKVRMPHLGLIGN